MNIYLGHSRAVSHRTFGGQQTYQTPQRRLFTFYSTRMPSPLPTRVWHASSCVLLLLIAFGLLLLYSSSITFALLSFERLGCSCILLTSSVWVDVCGTVRLALVLLL
jgi:hypothetical protein